MQNSQGIRSRVFLANSMASFLQIGALLILIYLCFRIVYPFLNVIIWGGIISIVAYPKHKVLSQKIGGKDTHSAAILVFLGLAFVLIPCLLLAGSTFDAIQLLAQDFKEGRIEIPPPTEKVAQWPIIGPRLYELWQNSVINMPETLKQFAPQIRTIGQSLISFTTVGLWAVAEFIMSILVAGAFLIGATKCYTFFSKIFSRIAGESQGIELVDLSVITIRSVVKGILGVAFIQAVLAALGLYVMDVPAVGLWSMIVLILAVVQLPPLLILAPISLWLYSVGDSTSATLFFLYCIFVSFCDSLLTPMLLGRGIKIPMLVLLIGAIGGAIAFGVIGLFVGSVVLSLGYELLSNWVLHTPESNQLDNEIKS